MGVTFDSLPTAGPTLVTLFVQKLQALGIVLPAFGTGKIAAYFVNGPDAAVDQECLRVAFQTITMGMPSQPDSRPVLPSQMQFYAAFGVELWRSVPTLETGLPASALPLPLAIQNSGIELVKDAAALVTAAAQIKAEYLLTDYGTPFAIGPIEPVTPAGGLAANRLQLSFSIL